jgi:hypothetical protein
LADLTRPAPTFAVKSGAVRDHNAAMPRFMTLRKLVRLLLLTGATTALATEPVDFNFQIRPLLSDRCFNCHGPDPSSRKARLRLDTLEGLRKELPDGGAVVKPGQPDQSELIRRIFAESEDDVMPPPETNLQLTPAEMELLQRWIAEGAEYKSHWAFLPVGAVKPPSTTDTNWVRNPIDQFVLARLGKEKLAPAAEAAPETLLRRLTLDLTGLPPTVVELDAFLADHSPAAYERAVARLLASPHYGERMALDWLDLARFADTYGYQNDVERDMSPWRDWVIKAFNENLPFDQFITWQLAGDLLPNATREQRLATAFNRLHRQTNEGGSIDDEFRAEYAADRVNTVGTAMLGLTLGCARCHDHKFDPITQRDYYAMTAFFNSIDESGTYSHFTRATPTPTLLLWPAGKEQQHAELKQQITMTEESLKTTRRAAETEFQSWRAAGGKIAAPQPIAHFAFDTVASNTTPDSVTTNVAKLVDEPKLVDGAPSTGSAGRDTARQRADLEIGARNQALQFSGDNQVVCKSVRNFSRTDEFTFSLRLKPTEKQDRAVVLHQSRAWADSGSRGFELTLDHGKPFFGLIHFWPGNAMSVRATRALPLNEWSQLTVTYDGSSRAAGIRLYLDGDLLETEIVRDNLSKDIIHRAAWGDLEVGKVHLQLASRFRDSGFKNGLIDDLQVFDVALTEAEANVIAAENSLALTRSPSERESQPLKNHFLARVHTPTQDTTSELKKLRAQENALINDVPEIMTMEEMPAPRPTHLRQRGAYDAPGEVVARDTPAAVLPFPKDQPRDRLGLARWMTDRQNPLTARVAVNRIWRLHFGRGLVVTEQDFGSQGKLPTHPELLDWLAGWFMDHGWDVKALHKLIVTSATYRQSSQASRALVERDPDNALLARGPKHRLAAELIRDGALAASGLLVTNIGGPSVKPYQPAGLWEQSGTGKSYTQDHGEKLYRRSLYTFWKRTAPPPAMLTFDAVTREVCTANRETTATPLQALVLLNDPQFVEAARVLAEKLLKQFPHDEAARISAAFRALTGRTPDAKEVAVSRQLLVEQKLFYSKDAVIAKKLLSTGESKWDESLPQADFAATTMLVSAVMNFDEFVMQR